MGVRRRFVSRHHRCEMAGYRERNREDDDLTRYYIVCVNMLFFRIIMELSYAEKSRLTFLD